MKYFIIILILLAAICYPYGSNDKEIRSNGSKARQSYVPSQSNPYITSHDRQVWLEGWMDDELQPRSPFGKKQ